MRTEPATRPLAFVDWIEERLAAHPRLAGLALTWFGSLLGAFYYLGVILRDDMYVNDMAIHIPWTYRIDDPALFPSDSLIDYMQQFSPAGVKLLFQLTVPFADPRSVAKLSALPLHAIVVYLVYRIGKVLADNRRVGGWLAVCLIALRVLDPAGSMFHWLQGAMARSFAFPVVLWAALGVLTGRRWMLGAASLAGAIFYPPVALIVGLLTAVSFLADELPFKARMKAWASGLALAALAGAYLAGLSLSMHGSRFGDLITLSQAVNMKEYGPAGPLSSILPEPTIWSSMVELRFGLYPEAVVLAVTYWWLCRRQLVAPRFARLAGLIAGVGFALFVAAYLLLFRLYEPSRYIYLSYYVASIFLAVPIALRLLDFLGQRGSAMLGKLNVDPHRWSLALGLGVVFLATAATTTATVSRCNAGKGGNRPILTREIYDALRGLPKDALVAGHPGDLSDVPLIAKRSAYLTPAVLYPYYSVFYSEMRGRLSAYGAVAYADSWAQIESFAKDSGVDVILVNEMRYGAVPVRWLPMYDEELDKFARARRTGSLALLEAPRERVLVKSGPLRLVDVRPQQSPRVTAGR